MSYVVYANDTSIFASNNNLINLPQGLKISRIRLIELGFSNKLICNQENNQKMIISLSPQFEDTTSVRLPDMSIDSKTLNKIGPFQTVKF